MRHRRGLVMCRPPTEVAGIARSMPGAVGEKRMMPAADRPEVRRIRKWLVPELRSNGDRTASRKVINPICLSFQRRFSI